MPPDANEPNGPDISLQMVGAKRRIVLSQITQQIFDGGGAVYYFVNNTGKEDDP
jgi:hypothetical protein